MSISVVIPAYQAALYIREAIGSVLAQLPASSEVIVVDDGSHDDTAAVAERFGTPVRVIRARHGGIGASVNRGIAESRNSMIASIDADDRWLPGKMDRQLAAFAEDPSLDAVFGFLRQFLSPEAPPEQFAFTGEAIPGLCRGAMLIRREAWERVGPLETDLAVGEFVSWYSRAMDCGLKTRMLADLVYERRVHGANTVIRERDAHGDYLRVVKATLDRRRAAQASRSAP